jgi:thymidylate kinase
MKILFKRESNPEEETSPNGCTGELRSLVIPLFQAAEKLGIDYCVCGNYHGLPDYTSHDIDIWAKDTVAFEKTLLNVAARNGFTLYLCNKTANGFNNFFYKMGGDGLSFVQIDILRECAWLPFIPIVRSKRIEEGRIRYKDFWVAEPVVESAMHLLYPLFHSGRVKEKYREKIYFQKDSIRFYRILSEALGSTAAYEIIKMIGDRDWQGLEQRVRHFRIRLIINSLLKDNFRNLGTFFQFITINISRLFSPSGLFIVFVGLDGCGKTTIVNDLSIQMSNCFTSGKIKKFYWRPFFLPRLSALIPFKREKVNLENPVDAGLRTVSRNPLAVVKYLLKFFYYLFDFIIGRLRYQSAWSRGGLVLFDRYYYDHLVYPERFGFHVPGWIMKPLMALVPEPELKFFLYAPTETLMGRKQELPLEEIRRQDKEYKKIISSLHGGYLVNTDRALEETQKEIMEICFSYMTQKLKGGQMDKRLEFFHYLCPAGESVTLLNDAGIIDRNLQTFKSAKCVKVTGASLNVNSSYGVQDGSNVVCSLATSRLPDFVIKHRMKRKGFEVTSSYLVIPGFSNPRWFLPNSRTVIKNTGNIVKPSSLKGRTAWNLIRLMSSIGFPQTFFPDRLIIASRSDARVPSNSVLKELLEPVLNKERISFIIYNGSNSYYQKSTVQVMDHDGATIAYAKIGSTGQARERIEAEGTALMSLAGFSFSKLKFPELISLEQLKETDVTVLVQTPPPKSFKEFNRTLDDRHIDALIELFLKTRKVVKGDELLSDIMVKIKKLSTENVGRTDVIDDLGKAILHLVPGFKGTDITISISHGDFTPWNIYLNNGELFAFDWELSATRVPLWDVYNFILHSEVLIFDRSAKDIFRMLLTPSGKYYSLIKRYELSTGISDVLDDGQLLSYYLIEILIYYLELSKQQKNSGLNKDMNGEAIIQIASSLLKIVLARSNND